MDSPRVSCDFNNVIAFSNEKTALVNEGRAVDAVCLVFRKSFHMSPIRSW